MISAKSHPSLPVRPGNNSSPSLFLGFLAEKKCLLFFLGLIPQGKIIVTSFWQLQGKIFILLANDFLSLGIRRGHVNFPLFGSREKGSYSAISFSLLFLVAFYICTNHSLNQKKHKSIDSDHPLQFILVNLSERLLLLFFLVSKFSLGNIEVPVENKDVLNSLF